MAFDALPGFELRPARLSADHFFAAVSVSPQGRYALGYEAAGAPKAGGTPAALDEILLELTGKPRLDRRLSFLRLAGFTDGRVALRQIGGGPAWVADVRRLVFRKTGGQVTADAEVEVEGDRGPATLVAHARAAIGLNNAFVRADVENLTPAHVFPSVARPRRCRGSTPWCRDPPRSPAIFAPGCAPPRWRPRPGRASGASAAPFRPSSPPRWPPTVARDGRGGAVRLQGGG